MRRPISPNDNRGMHEKMSKQTEPQEILTLAQVAEWLQIAERQVTRYKIPGFRLGKKTARYRRADVEAWLLTKREET